MGRRSTSTTKSGKFMNPADQERKQIRKKELRKNKKQRVAVRQAMLKAKDPDDIIEQLEKLDQIEFELGPESTIKKQVLMEKRSKLKGTFFNVMTMYRNEKEPEKVKDMNRRIQQYEIRRHEMEQNFEAIKFSKEADLGAIPLPDGLAIPGAALTPSLSSAIPSHLLLPDGSPKPSILKKSTRKIQKSEHPPGVPGGLPPDLSESDDDDKYEDNDTRDHVSRRKKVRFGDEIPEERQTNRTFHGESDAPPPLMSLHPLAPHTPLLSLVPPPIVMANRMPLRAPPPAPYGRPRTLTPNVPSIGPQSMQIPLPNSAAVIFAEPQVVRRQTTISAKPQLRNMQKEAVRFVPTNLRVQRQTPISKKTPIMTGGLKRSVVGLSPSTTIKCVHRRCLCRIHERNVQFALNILHRTLQIFLLCIAHYLLVHKIIFIRFLHRIISMQK